MIIQPFILPQQEETAFESVLLNVNVFCIFKDSSSIIFFVCDRNRHFKAHNAQESNWQTFIVSQSLYDLLTFNMRSDMCMLLC